MVVDSASTFLSTLRDNGFLEPGRLEQLGKMPEAQAADPRVLARVIVKKGWLTKFQAALLLAGRGKELSLGPYRILDRLGEGGMGQVYKAHHGPMNRTVALKVIRKEKLANPEAVQRFYREVQAAAKLSHPNIVMAYDAGQTGTTHYLAMEYVDGVTLAQLVKESGPLPIHQACEYVRQAARGLQHAFERGLVHRDIKPQNLLVTGLRGPGAAVKEPGASSSVAPDPRTLVPVIKIMDMGLARLEETRDGEAGLTQEGKVIGTPDYLAPEQAKNARQADLRSDLYSLGCTLFYLLTGKAPFQGTSLMDILLKHQLEAPPSLEALRPEVPAALAAVVVRLMAKRPEDRFQTPAEVVQGLEPFCGPGGSAVRSGVIPAPAMGVHSGRDFGTLAGALEPTEPPVLSEADDTTATVSAAAMLVPPMRTPARAIPKRWLIIGGIGLGLLLHLIGFLMLGTSIFSKSDKEPSGTAGATTQVAARQEGREEKQAGAGHETKRSPAPVSPALPRVPQAGSQPFPGGKSQAPEQEPVQKGHLDGGAVNAVAFSPDSRHVLVGGEGGDLLLVEMATWRVIRRYEAQNGKTASVAFSPDGGRLAAGGFQANPTLAVYDVESGRELRRFDGHTGAICSVAFSPDGTRLLSGSIDQTARLWDANTGAEVRRFEGNKQGVRCVAYAPDGRHVVSGGDDGSITLYDANKGQVVSQFQGHMRQVWSVAFSPGGRYILSAGEDGTVRLWDVDLAKEIRRFTGHELRVAAVAFSPDGSRVLSGGNDKTIRLWDLRTGKELYRFTGHDAWVTSVAMSPDARWIVAGCFDGFLRLWRVPEPPAVVQRPTDAPTLVPGAPSPAQARPVPKLPVPDATQQAQTLKAIKAEFKEEYTRRTGAERLALATKLLDKAALAKDDATTRYVLFSEARDLAAAVANVPTFVRAVDAMAREFTIDPVAMKTIGLETALPAAATPAEYKAIVGLALAVIEEAAIADSFETALRLLPLADTAARKAQNLDVFQLVQRREKDVRALHEEYEIVKIAAKTLKVNANDANANLVTGKYLCFRKGKWDLGLSCLARGSDAVLKNLAIRDLAKAQDPETRLALADAWWDLAHATETSAKAAILQRAAHWYQQAVGAGLAGANFERAEKRFREIGGPAPAPNTADSPDELRRILEHGSRVTSVSISSDGHLVLSGGSDGSVRMWDAESGVEARRFDGSTGEIHCVALAPDAKAVLAGGPDGLWLWDLASGQSNKRLRRNPGPEMVVFSSDGSMAVTAGLRGSVQTYYVAEARAGWGISAPSWGSATSAALSANNRFVAIVTEEPAIRFYDIVARKAVGKPLHLSFAVLSMVATPDGRAIIGGCSDRIIRMWDVSNGQLIRSFRGHQGPVTSVAISGDGHRLVSGSEDRTVRFWDAKSGRELYHLEGHTEKVWSVAVAFDGRRAVSGSSDKTVRVWSVTR
jgi:WD40 repeat protein/serine/threonine protein kinase